MFSINLTIPPSCNTPEFSADQEFTLTLTRTALFLKNNESIDPYEIYRSSKNTSRIRAVIVAPCFDFSFLFLQKSN